MEKNPLRNLLLDEPIDTPITRHFEQGWLNDFSDEFFDSGVFKIYHINFILGLLCSIQSSEQENNVFYRLMGDKNENLRIFIVRNEQIIFHDIFYTDQEWPSWKEVTKDELDDVVLTLRELHFKLNDELHFERLGYIVRRYRKNVAAKWILMMELWQVETLTYEVPETPGKGSSESVTAAKKVLSTIDFCYIYFWPFFEKYSEEQERLPSFTYPFILLSNSTKHELVVAEAAIWHRSLFGNMPDTYHNILRNSSLPAVSYRRGAVSLCLPKKDTSNEYVMFNVPVKGAAAYGLLMAHRRNDLVIHQLSNGTAYPPYYTLVKSREFRPVKLTFRNIMRDIVKDFSNGKNVSYITDYFEVIGQFFKMQGIRTKEHVEAFSLGYLMAADEATVGICVGLKKNKTFPIEFIVFEGIESNFFFTFKNNDAITLPERENGTAGYMLQLNFATSMSDADNFQISAGYAPPNELRKKCGFVEHTPKEFNRIIPQMIDESDAESTLTILPGQIDFYSDITIRDVSNHNLIPHRVNNTLMLTNFRLASTPNFDESPMTTINTYRRKYKTINAIFKDKMLRLNEYNKVASKWVE
uniref:Uncharacterized protein n=1 Tax=Romanomermis culicivorax TaxID=13658 RepID=A0A915ISE1_ROMCU